MTMAGQNPISRLLDGMVHCRHCNAAMATSRWHLGGSPRYVCSHRQDDCDTPEVPAEALARLMVERVIRAALEGDNTRRVAEAVRDEARERSQDYTWARLEEAMGSLGVDDGFPLMAPPSTYLTMPDPETRKPLDLEPAKYIEPLRKLNRYWNTTGDTGHIAGYAFDPGTYLRPNNIGTTRAIIEAAVDEILVGSRSVTIRYRTRMPPGSGTEGKFQEEVELIS